MREASWEILAEVVPPGGGVRMNDGRTDPLGRFWAGSMNEGGEDAVGALYAYLGDGSYERVVEGVRISNGLCWSRDGESFYFTDSPTGVIRRFSMRDWPGVGVGEVFHHVTDGHPDGAVIDGREVGSWAIPCSQPTSVAFGGPDMDWLFVTSAREGLSQEQLARHPDSGAVFVFETQFTGCQESICDYV